MGFSIIGTGSALPGKTVKNSDLTAFLDTSDEWISTRTGIGERRVITDESLTALAADAAKKAIADARIKASEIDILICSTLSGDSITPSLSCIVAGELGLRSDCLTFDMNMACCGFVYALNIADAYLKTSAARKALIVSAEGMSRLTDWQDRSTCVLFGDAAAAAVLASSVNEVYFDINLQPNAEFLRIDRAADNCPYHTYAEKNTLKMNGQEVYKFASTAIYDRICAVLEKSNISADEVDKFLLHQANIRIIESSIHRLKIDGAKFPHNIEKYGNTSSASVPLLLDELRKSGEIEKGGRIVLCAFGAGLASIACLLKL